MKILKLKSLNSNSKQIQKKKMTNALKLKTQLNKIANIIYKYHLNNKKILQTPPKQAIASETFSGRRVYFSRSSGTIRMFSGCMHWLFTASSAVLLRDDRMSFADNRESSSANALPIPDEAPVIQMILLL